MHRRARHLTGRAAGAELYFDSRRIYGLSDGTGVQTWDDLSTNANNATQATSGNRPLYKVNIQGGNPMLLFDNSNDYLRCSNTATLGSASTQVYLFKLSSASSNVDVVFYYGNFNVYSPNYNWVGFAHDNGNYQLGNYNNPTEGSVFYTANTSTRVLSGVLNDSGTNRMFLEGSQVATATYTTITGISSSARPMIGEVENASTPGTYMDGYIGVIGYWSVLTTTSLRKRFEQAIGFSFKIACS
jgi:hypothetical protein